MINPRDLGVPHDSWRPNQFKTYQHIKQVMDNNGGFVFAELGTGSGKSAIATAMGHEQKVLVVVHTLGLLDQYAELYGFKVVKGRQEYECVLPEKVNSWQSFYGIEPTAADCTYSPMHSCPSAGECPYLIAKHEALESKRAACTYRYIAVSRLMKEREGNIVLDEAHDAAEELIRFNEFSYMYKTIEKYKLPPFPIQTFGEYGRGAIVDPMTKKTISAWVAQCTTKLVTKTAGLDEREDMRVQRMLESFTRFADSLNQYQWFLELQPKYGFAIKALSAAPIAESIFLNKSTKLLMSATIGDPEPLATALGIKSYEYITFPHPVPPDKRPVYDLDVPRMTAHNIKQDPAIFDVQAHAIWEWIQTMSSYWRGVILTSSYQKIEQIYTRLEKWNRVNPRPRRIYRQQSGQRVNALVEQFIKDVEPGDIMIGTIQGWGSGLDLRGELARWLVVAGVPHVNPTDQYAKARRQLAGGQRYQDWTVYNAVMQAAGRVSRGEETENGDWIPNYVALADGSAVTNKAKRFYGDWFTEAIVEVIL